ncbi:MAG: hypothetical protein KTR14_06940 [Vampirovibrio sp.]|nr:hypothetical protein [Vampirovibrio sp.]
MEDLIEKLKGLGFNTYESKVYITLLNHHPATGYEISKESGVPQARAYDTLKALETNRIVVSNGGKPTTYMPVSPHELLDRHERSFKSSMAYLRETLPNLTEETIAPVLNLRGEAAIFNHAIETISSAQKTIFMELWLEDGPKMEPYLREASERGVEIRIVGYDGLSFDFCPVYSHGHSKTIDTPPGSRWVMLTRDECESVAGFFTADKSSHGVLTRNSDIVLLIKELMIHDIFLLELENKLGPEIEAVFGKDLIQLRQEVLGAKINLEAIGAPEGF